MTDMWAIEREFRAQGFRMICGVDVPTAAAGLLR